MSPDDALYSPAVLANTAPGRAAFLRRVRSALGHGDTAPPPTDLPPVDPALYRQVPAAAADLLARYTAVATAAGMKVEVAASAEVSAALDRCLAAHQVKLLLLNAGPFETRFALRAHLEACQIDTFRWGDPDCRARAYQCEASITDCRFALADNGALAVWSDATFGRSSTLTMAVHIVLLPASSILPDLADGFARLAHELHGELPSNIVLISGPSKTADIEMNLVTGVHGPKYLYVIILRDL